jgi:rRNA maturation endonuclease Nob1
MWLTNASGLFAVFDWLKLFTLLSGKAMASMKRQVMQLYRQCLRSARKCPQWEQKEMMKTYVRLKFQEAKDTRDPRLIEAMISEAKEELDRMEYYHSLYQAKLREEAPNNKKANRDTKPSKITSNPQLVAACPNCGQSYELPQAKFCSNCGVKRPTLS